MKLKIENPDIEDNDKSFFRIGSALDCLLTSPEKWETDFKVIEANKPFGLMGKFVDNLPSGLEPTSPLEDYKAAYDKSGYKMWMDKVVSKFWENEEAVKYYKLTRDLEEGITVISQDEYDSVTKARELIMANEFTSKFFRPIKGISELMTQITVLFDYAGEHCKGILDGIYIDHLDKTIQAFDLKTTSSSVYEFGEMSYLKYGYYRQCAIYELALNSETSPIKHLLDTGYKMLDFIFIVVESKKTASHPAVIYRTSVTDREVGMNGGYIGRRFYKGVNQLIEEYKFHRETNYWDLPVELFKANGEIKLDVFDAK